ncbi:MAG: AraC family transcriptional regulator [Monoglobaceae bacterium]
MEPIFENNNPIFIPPEDELTNFSSKKYMNINHCGRLSRCAYRILREHGRLDYHIVYVISGYWETVYDNRKYSLKPGSFVFYEPFQPQDYTFFPYNEGCEIFMLYFSGTAVSEILNDINLVSGVYQCRKSEVITSIFSELVREHNLSRPYSQSAQNALAIYLLTAFSRHASNILEATYNTTLTADLDINRIIIEMNGNYTDAYNSKHYANICGLSVSGFYNKFKRVIGVSPKKYFTNIKIEHAKELIAFSELSIKEIASMFGYEDSLYFSRLFKQATGLSPSEYRSQSKKSIKQEN